jgi:flagellar hook-length control protein FliK
MGAAATAAGQSQLDADVAIAARADATVLSAPPHSDLAKAVGSTVSDAHAIDARSSDGSDSAVSSLTSTVPLGGSASTLASASTPTPSTAAALERSIGVPVGSHEWGRAVAAEVHVLAASGVKEATLRLSPEHLGPVEVRIDLQDTKVNVSFTATHAETRTALEQSVPQLRDMLAGSGLSLGHANVQQETRSGSHNFTPRALETTTEDVEEQSVMTAVGLVDEYA